MRWNRTSSDAFFYWMKVLVASLGLLMFIVWQHVQGRHLERQLNTMRKEEDQLVYQNARLQSQLNQWLSPSHLETMARKELSMAAPDAKHRVGVEFP
jgi:cell division protein FtsL